MPQEADYLYCGSEVTDKPRNVTLFCRAALLETKLDNLFVPHQSIHTNVCNVPKSSYRTKKISAT